MASDISEEEVIARINELKGLILPKEKGDFENTNKKLDSIWTFLQDNKEKAIPILIKEIEAEITKNKAGIPSSDSSLKPSTFSFVSEQVEDLDRNKGVFF